MSTTKPDLRPCGRCGADNDRAATRCRRCNHPLPATVAATTVAATTAAGTAGARRKWGPVQVSGSVVTTAQPGRFVPLTAWPAAAAIAVIAACCIFSPPRLGGGFLAGVSPLAAGLVGVIADLVWVTVPTLLVPLLILFGVHLMFQRRPRGLPLPRMGVLGLVLTLVGYLVKLLVAVVKVAAKAAVWVLRQVAAPQPGVSFVVVGPSPLDRWQVVLLHPSPGIVLRSDVEIRGFAVGGAVRATNVRVLTTRHTVRAKPTGIVLTVLLGGVAILQVAAAVLPA